MSAPSVQLPLATHCLAHGQLLPIAVEHAAAFVCPHSDHDANLPCMSNAPAFLLPPLPHDSQPARMQTRICYQHHLTLHDQIPPM
jgi:hypothetical protein